MYSQGSRTKPEPHSTETPAGMPAELSQLRLLDSMLHEARNPLNAIAIHLEILSEKLRKAGIPNIDSNLQAIRAQLSRVDDLFKKFGAFMLPKKRGGGTFALPSAVELAVELLDYECRRKQLSFRTQIQPRLSVFVADASAASSLLMALLLRSLDRAPSGSRVEVTISAENGKVVVAVSDTGGGELEADFHTVLEALCNRSGGKLIHREYAIAVAFPVVQPS